MTNREKAVALLDDVPDYKLGYVVAFLMGLVLSEEADRAWQGPIATNESQSRR